MGLATPEAQPSYRRELAHSSRGTHWNILLLIRPIPGVPSERVPGWVRCVCRALDRGSRSVAIAAPVLPCPDRYDGGIPRRVAPLKPRAGAPVSRAMEIAARGRPRRGTR